MIDAPVLDCAESESVTCRVIFPAELARHEASFTVYSSPSILPAELAVAVTLFALPLMSMSADEAAFSTASVPVCSRSAEADELTSQRNKGAVILASMSPEDEPLITTRLEAVRSGMLILPDELMSMFSVAVLIGVLAVIVAELLAWNE